MLIGVVLWFLSRGGPCACPSDNHPPPLVLRRAGKGYPYTQQIPTMLTSGLFVLTLTFDAWLLWTFASARADTALTSPWNVLPPNVFAVFAIATLSLLWLARRNASLGLAATVVHFFTAFSVSSFVYALGFGFDPFLHRAAEGAMIRDGIVEPMRLLYSGQYVLVSAIQTLTKLPLLEIERWLVPMLAAILIPVGIVLGSKGKPKCLPLLLILPFLPFTFTVPFNLAFTLCIFVAAIAPWCAKHRGRQIGLVLTAIFACTVHPLAGIPALWIAIVNVGVDLRVHPSTGRLGGLPLQALLSLALAATLSLAVVFGAETASVIWHPIERFVFFLGLFQDPYRAIVTGSWFWETLYALRTWLLPLILVSSVSIGWLSRADRHTRLLASAILGLLLAAWFISTSVVFGDIIWYEQQEFSLRLIQLAGALGLVVIIRVRPTGKLGGLPLQIFFTFLIALLATAGLYLSYPQDNPKVTTSGPSVSRGDIEAIEWIERDAAEEPHIILANQMTSAVSIERFGFQTVHSTSQSLNHSTTDLLQVPLPTGGPLYAFVWELLINGDTNAIDEAAAFADVHLVYTVWHRYEWWTPGFPQMLEQKSGNCVSFDGGNVLLCAHHL